MAQSLIQNVVDTMDSAHMQRGHLTELLSTLREAREQITVSASSSRESLKQYFDALRLAVEGALQERLDVLVQDVDKIEADSLKSITEFEETVKESLQAASQVMEEGKQILSNNPDENVEKLVKFKDNPNTKNLECIPESPNLSDVPFISVELREGLDTKISEIISEHGRVIERAPVQITDIVERPGSLLVKWAEIDEDIEDAEFCLQYCYGKAKYNNLSQATFHTAYTGPGTSHTVRHLRTNTAYSFRVRCKTDREWSVWSVPRVASTSISHYQWNSTTEGYSTSNEDKTATREVSEETKVLYSSGKSYTCGYPITFTVLDAGENSPLDGIGMALTNENTDTMKSKDAIFVSTRGTVFVDGQEMKTKLPALGRGSKLSFETEDLANGKIRVSVEVEGKEVTFDWKVDQDKGITGIPAIGGMPSVSGPAFFFGMQFSHEDWKISVE